MAQATRKGAAAKKAPKAPTAKELATRLDGVENRLVGVKTRTEDSEGAIRRLEYRVDKIESRESRDIDSVRKSLDDFKKSVRKHAAVGAAAIAALAAIHWHWF